MKKIVLGILVFVMCLTTIFNEYTYVNAEESSDMDIPFSELMTDNAIVGYSDAGTWGVYYGSGVSIINDSGGGKIGWGGATHARVSCKVSVNAIVERYSGGSWLRVTSASNTREDSLTAVVSKMTLVGSGYYYRVRCSHNAATDRGYSSTDALRM